MIRQACGEGFLIVAPGIRLGGEEEDDQKRVDTPQAAFDAGANYIVVGRPILRAADPSIVVQKINASIHGLDPDKIIEQEPAAEEVAAEEPSGDKPVEEPKQEPPSSSEEESTVRLDDSDLPKD
jgi:hypothetical protein